MEEYISPSQVSITILARESIAVIKHDDYNQLGEELVLSYSVESVHYPGNAEELKAGTWKQELKRLWRNATYKLVSEGLLDILDL